MYFLTSDIGGTNARFALFTKQENKYVFLYSTWLMSQEYDSFSSLYKKLCEEDENFAPHNIEQCVIALAGVVKEENYAKLTNLSWGFDLKEVKKHFPNFPKTKLINDFAAQAMACTLECKNNFVPFFNANNMPYPLLITGAGTGFGCAFLSKIEEKTTDGKEEKNEEEKIKYFLQPSEFGLTNFCFDTSCEIEMKLAHFLHTEKKLSSPFIEHFLSGTGLSYIHEFLTKEKLTPKEVPPTSPAFELFSRFYARTLRQLCLSNLSKSAIITGGVVAKHEGILNEAFHKEFLKHDIMSHVLEDVVFYLNKEENIALYGATAFFD